MKEIWRLANKTETRKKLKPALAAADSVVKLSTTLQDPSRVP